MVFHLIAILLDPSIGKGGILFEMVEAKVPLWSLNGNGKGIDKPLRRFM